MKTLFFSFQRIAAFACLLLLAVTGWSCKKDDVSARTQAGTLFTLKVNKIVDKPDVFYQTPGQNKYYVVVGDASGKLIDYKQLTPQTTFAFDKPEGFTDTELTVSYVAYSPKYGYFVSSYRNIPVGQEWVARHLDEDAAQPPIPQESQFKVRVSNIPDNAKGITPLNDYVTRTDLKTNTDYPIKIYKNSGNTMWFRLDYTNQPPKFFLLSNASANQSYTLDLSKFEEGVAKSIKFTKPVPVEWFAVNGTSSTGPHGLFGITNTPEVGTVANTPIIDKIDFYAPKDNFSSYTIYSFFYQSSMSNTNNAQSQLTGTFETLPGTLPVIDADFTVTTNTPNSFAMTTTGIYTMYNCSGSINRTPQNTSVAWGVYGKSQANVSFNYAQIPEAIIPVSTKELKMSAAGLETFTYPKSYEDFFTTPFSQQTMGYHTTMGRSLQ